MKKKTYTPEFKKSVVAEHANGATVDELVKKYGVARNSIYNWIRRAALGENLMSRGLDRIPDNIRGDIASDYEKTSAREVTQKYKIGESTLYRILRERGVQLKREENTSNAIKRALCEDRLFNNLSYDELSKKYNVPKGTISYWISCAKKSNNESFAQEQNAKEEFDALVASINAAYEYGPVPEQTTAKATTTTPTTTTPATTTPTTTTPTTTTPTTTTPTTNNIDLELQKAQDEIKFLKDIIRWMMSK